MNQHIYQAAHEGSIWRDLSHFGRFRVSGRDAGALLHHLTTNDIKKLKIGQGCDAALVTSKGRLLDWLWIFREESGFLVITSPNRRALFAPHARGYIVFRQDVTIEDVTDATGLCAIFGPQVGQTLESIVGPDIENAPQLTISQDAGTSILAAKTNRLPQGGALLWSANREELNERIKALALPECDAQTYNVLRIEAGLPVAGLELGEEFNPWEANLNDSISLHKGCYNGQEVIARLNTYQKIKQRLRGLKLDELPQSERAILRVEGRDAGILTSRVLSPRFGPIALAYLRSDYQTLGQRVEVVDGETILGASVVELPFETIEATR